MYIYTPFLLFIYLFLFLFLILILSCFLFIYFIYFILFYFILCYVILFYFFLLHFILFYFIFFNFNFHFIFIFTPFCFSALKKYKKYIWNKKNNNESFDCHAKYGQIHTLSSIGGVLDRKGRKVGYWCVTVAATRGGSLSIAVQPWLKGNSTHKQKKGNWRTSSHKITEGRATKQEKKRQFLEWKEKGATRVKEQEVSSDAVNMNWNVCNWWCVIK